MIDMRIEICLLLKLWKFAYNCFTYQSWKWQPFYFIHSLGPLNLEFPSWQSAGPQTNHKRLKDYYVTYRYLILFIYSFIHSFIYLFRYQLDFKRIFCFKIIWKSDSQVWLLKKVYQKSSLSTMLPLGKMTVN